MRLGIAKADPSGRITATLVAPGLHPFTVELAKLEKTNDRAPDWEVRLGLERCGALWKRKSRDGGLEFLSGPLESPVFPGGELDITWNPPREERQAAASAPASAPAGSAPVGTDDDEIPF